MDDPAVERAREAALRLLDRSRRTRQQIARRLGEQGHAARAVGIRVLEGQLRLRGVSDADRARALADLAAEADREATPSDEASAWRGGGAGERARAERALAPLLRRWRDLEPRERRARATAALLRRGFDWPLAREVVAATPGLGGASDPGAEPL